MVKPKPTLDKEAAKKCHGEGGLCQYFKLQPKNKPEEKAENLGGHPSRDFGGPPKEEEESIYRTQEGS